MTTNSRVKIGGFLLGKELKAKFEEFTAFTSDERPSDPGIKMHAGLYFHAKDVWESDVGDIRVQFSYAGREGEQVIQMVTLKTTPSMNQISDVNMVPNHSWISFMIGNCGRQTIWKRSKTVHNRGWINRALILTLWPSRTK